MSPKIDIPPPIRGVNEDLAFRDQPPTSARDAKNVVSIDGTNGRTRLAQRDGLSKYVDTKIDASGSKKVSHLTSITTADNLLGYAKRNSAAVTEEFTTVTSSKKDTRRVIVDSTGQVHYIDGNNAFGKRNHDGALVYTQELPVPSKEAVLQAFHVDTGFNVYIGVSSGGPQTDARLWAYRPNDDDKVDQLWELTAGDQATDLLFGFVTDCTERNGRLYTVQNDDSNWTAYLAVYASIETPVPILDYFRIVPYPALAVEVKEDGSAIISSDEFSNRGKHPKDPDTTQKSVDWTPLDLPRAEERIWSWYKGDEINFDQLIGELDEGDPVRVWRDVSGNFRHLREYVDQTLDPASETPFFIKQGLAGMPGVRFEGQQALRTAQNSGNNESQGQRAMVPGYPGCMWAMFIVIRPASIVADTTAEQQGAQRIVFTLVDTKNNDRHHLIINRSSGTTTGGAGYEANYSQDGLSYFITNGAKSGGGGGSGTVAASGVGGKTPKAAVVTIVNNGDDSVSTQTGQFRVNGLPVDSFDCHDFELDGKRTQLGRDTGGGPGTDLNNYQGEIYEIIVIRDIEDSTLFSDFGDKGTVTFLDYPDTAFDTENDSELQRIEGYLAHKYGISHNLNQGTPSTDHPHPWFLNSTTTHDKPSYGPPSVDLAFGTISEEVGLQDTDPLVAKFSNQGKVIWSLAASGVGYDAILAKAETDGDEKGIFCVGPRVSPSAVTVRRISDLGDTVSTGAGDGAWTSSEGTTDDPSADVRIDRDEFDNVYVPFVSTVSPNSQLYVIDGDGTEGTPGVTLLSIDLTDDQTIGYQASVDPITPDYGSADIERPEFVWVCTNNDDDGTVETLHKLQLVTITSNTGSPRTVTKLAVAAGIVKKFDAPSTVSTITGGSALDADADFIDSTTLIGKVYLVDGLNTVVYDPDDDEVSTLEADGSGRVPKRAKLVSNYRGRLVLARTADQPFGFFLSEVGEPDGWNFNPASFSPGQAFDGSVTDSLSVEDIINTVIPADRDHLVFGCDRRIFVLEGDPLLGGQMDKVTDDLGMSFGRPWCKNRQGSIYFNASRGGIWRMAPNGTGIEPLTENRIERRLRDIDYASFYVELAYDPIRYGVHVFVIPFGDTGSVEEHFFYDEKNDAWWPIEYNSASLAPTAVLVLDGDDADDRVLAIGCADSFVRELDEDEENDDGTAIQSSALLGPFRPRGLDQELIWKGLRATLDSSLSGCRYVLYSSNHPNETGDPKRSGRFQPGGNNAIHSRVRGAFTFVELSNRNSGERWALEELVWQAEPAGRIRRRRRGA